MVVVSACASKPMELTRYYAIQAILNYLLIVMNGWNNRMNTCPIDAAAACWVAAGRCRRPATRMNGW